VTLSETKSSLVYFYICASAKDQTYKAVVICSSELYSTIVICAVHSNYYLFIYGSPVDEPWSSEHGVVRDVTSSLVQLPGPQHGLGRAP
jgi:hypothetical protein